MKKRDCENYKGIYDPTRERDACGIGAVVNIDGRQEHQVVTQALDIVEKLEHRAGKDAEGKTGDGVGIMLQISHEFFVDAAAREGFAIGAEGDYGVGMFFFPQDQLKRSQAMKMMEVIAKKEGVEFIGWRKVPTREDVLGQLARDCMPYIMQGFFKCPRDIKKAWTLTESCT